MLSVVERFVSINGEGAHAGELAVFIRFRGCNLNCSYCDTKWANHRITESQEYSVERLARWVRDKRITNVTLTGGEPLLQDEIELLIELLLRQGNRVEIETNGSLPLDKLAKAQRRPLFTMDYKLPSSGMEIAMRRDNFKLLNKHDTVKFVSGSQEDLKRAKEIIDEYRLTERCHVYLSPVFGRIDPAEIVGFMRDNEMNGVRLQLQLHKFIWKPDQRGV